MRISLKTSYEQDIRLFPDTRQALRYTVLVALAAALPLLLDDFLIGEVTHVLIWAIAGMGLMVLTGHAGQPSLGHAAFLAVGCYANAILIEWVGLAFVESFLLAGVITGLVGVLIAIPALRLSGLYLAIATLAFSILTEAASAEAVINPIPGMVASRLASSLPRNQVLISPSIMATRACNSRICSARAMMILHASEGMSGTTPSTS